MNTYDCNEGAEGTEALRSHYGLMLGLQRPWRVEKKGSGENGTQLSGENGGVAF